MILLKVALIGDGGAGKTALRNRYLGKGFKDSYQLTVGTDFAVHQTNVAGQTVKVQIWDLAGQPRFSQVRSLYYSGTRGILVVYDVTNPESFNNVPYWIKEALIHSEKYFLPIVLIGNKTDLRGEFPGVLQRKHGIALAREINNIPRKVPFSCKYIETSAKTGENVEEAFQELVEVIVQEGNLPASSGQKTVKALL